MNKKITLLLLITSCLTIAQNNISKIIVDKETTNGHVQLASKLFNIEYPNIVEWVDNHIPEASSIPISIVEMLEVLNRLSIMPKKDFNASVGSGELLYPAYMTYIAKDGELTFKVDMPGFEVEDVVATEVVDIPDFTVRIDMRKLSRALEGALVLSPTDMTNITYLGEKKPVKIESTNYLALVMPLVTK